MIARVDLRPDHWDIVWTILREHVPDRRVVAFGSRATWTAKEYSDLDLAVLGNDPLHLNVTSALTEGFSESDLPFKVDIVEWARIDESFRDKIHRHGVIVHSPKSSVAEANQTICTRIRSDWSFVKIEDISEKVAMGPFGSSIKVETFVDDGVPIISGSHLRSSRVDDGPGYKFISEPHAKRLSNANVQRGDIVFTHRGNIGQVAYIPDDSQYPQYVISQSQFFMRCDPYKAIPEFVTAYFKSPEGQHKLLANASQVGVPSIAQPVTYLRTIEIPLPPLHEQLAIAHILGRLDDKIELNRRMNETLEEMAQALFNSWFIQFDPVRAKMEGRDTGLPKHLADLFPNRLVDSELGEIPEGWKIRKIENLLELVYGKSLPAGKRRPGNIAVYGSGGQIGMHDTVLVGGPAVIVGRKGTVGSVYWEDGPIFPIDTVFYVVPRIGSLLFAYHLLISLPLHDMNTDSAVPGLNRNNAYQIGFALPTSGLLSAFETLVSSLWKRRALNLEVTKRLKQSQNLLLPELISGRMRFKDFEKDIEIAV